jgi:hypothetical protein
MAAYHLKIKHTFLLMADYPAWTGTENANDATIASGRPAICEYTPDAPPGARALGVLLPVGRLTSPLDGKTA